VPIDDRVERVESVEDAPRAGFTLRKGVRVELGEDEAVRLAKDERAAFKKAHPKEPGPYGFRSLVQVRRFGAHVPEEVLITFEDGTSETLQWPEEERWHRWEFVRPAKVASVQIDPGRKWLLDVDKLDDGRTRERTPGTARRWTLEAGAWLSWAMAFVGSL
jgi:hypothetical protein